MLECQSPSPERITEERLLNLAWLRDWKRLLCGRVGELSIRTTVCEGQMMLQLASSHAVYKLADNGPDGLS